MGLQPVRAGAGDGGVPSTARQALRRVAVQVVGAAAVGGRDAVSLAISARLLYVSGEMPRRQASPLFSIAGSELES